VKEETWAGSLPGAHPIGQMAVHRWHQIYPRWGWTGNVKSAIQGWTGNVKSAIRGWTGNVKFTNAGVDQ
jgi:hypothetical protein